MSKDPAFLFYPGDYLRDTQNFNEHQQVAYDRIMCEHMRNICITQSQLNFFTKRLNEQEKEEFLTYLTKVDGGFCIEWVAESIEKRRVYSEGRRVNRSKKENNICESYDEHMEIEIENEIEDINNKESGKKKKTAKDYTPEFLSFWESYPNKSGSKKAAFDVWIKLGKELPGIDIIQSAILIQKAWRKNANGEFRPEWKDGERWLKNRMWEAEVSSVGGNTVGSPDTPVDDFRNCKECGKRYFKDDLNKNGLCVICGGKK
ncbi:MAG: hypothetical protein LLG40_13845 [Deltaproteobacteria bacterium]|nr:hypothetical protein [Deltaproteobacteria bacterium]